MVEQLKEGLLQVSARADWKTWVALALALGFGGGTGYVTSFIGAGSTAAWAEQKIINKDMRDEQATTEKVLIEIRTDIRWIREAIQGEKR